MNGKSQVQELNIKNKLKNTNKINKLKFKLGK